MSANAAPASPAPENPGIVGAFGTWMQQGVTTMSSGFDAMDKNEKGAADAASTMAKGAADVATGAATVAKDAAGVAVDGVVKLPVSGFASGHEPCTLAGERRSRLPRRGGEFVPHPRLRHRHQRRLRDVGEVPAEGCLSALEPRAAGGHLPDGALRHPCHVPIGICR